MPAITQIAGMARSHEWLIQKVSRIKGTVIDQHIGLHRNANR